jgi:hypothetical protein
MKKFLLFLVAIAITCIVTNAEGQIFQNGQAAAFAINAASPNVSGSMGTTASNITSPVVQTCFAIDAKHNCVYVADYFGNRILRFSYPITSNLPTANLVIGQANFTSGGYNGVTSTSMYNPQGLAVDTTSGTLYVLCSGQNRVLRFNNAHTIVTNGPAASAVFGQSGFTSATSGTSQNQLNINQGPACGNMIHYDQLTGALWISDNNNFRVLRFDNANSATSGANASAVLGQLVYTTNTTGLSDTKFNRPDGLTTIGSSLFLADPINQRVLRFDNVYSKANGAAADAVFGQTNFTSGGGGTSAIKFNSPTDVTGDQNNLIVSDPGSSRILIFSNPLTNTTANSVLLSTSLSSAGSGGNGASTGGANYDIEYDGFSGQLFVQDRNNARILVFQSCPAVNIAGPNSICNGAAITLTASGVNTYTWATNETTSSITYTPSTTTTYSVIGRYTSPTYTCINTAVKTVTVNAAPVITVNSGSICAGQSFTLSASGANTFTYSGGQVVNPTSTASYSVTGTSLNGCESAVAAISTVTVEALPIVTVANGTICSGNNFVINPSGAASFTIEGGNATVSPTTSRTYTIAGTSPGGCFGAVDATCSVLVNTTPTVSINNGTICSGTNFTLAPTGASSYTVQGGSLIVSPTASASYTVRGTSAQGCLSNNTATSALVVNTTPTVSANNGTICSGNSFTIVPGGANTYSIQGGAAIVAPNTSANYTVLGISAAGCISANTATSSLIVNTTPTVSVNNGTICSGTSFIIIPNGASTYTIQGGTSIVSPNAATSYTVRGQSTQGCISANTATSSVVVNVTPTVSVNNGTICSGNSFSIIPNGAASYVIQGGNAVVSPNTSATYTVSGTSSQGCVSANTATSSLTVNTTPTVSVNSGTICSGNSFTITPSGAANYVIAGGTAIVSPNTTTSYTVSGMSAQGCLSANTATSALTVNTTPTVSVNNGTICSGTTFTIVPNGAATYVIEGGNTTVSPNSNSTYTVIGTSAQGCVSANTATSALTVNTTPTVSVNSGTICEGATFTFVPTGATSYTIEGGSAIVSPTTSTSYTVSGSSTQGCLSVSNATAAILVNAKPAITIANAAICKGASFTLSAQGATTYTYSNGAIVTPSITSIYTVTGSSTQGCEGNANTVTITVNNLPVVTLSASSNQMCLNDASVQLSGLPVGGSYVGSNVVGTVYTPVVTGTFDIVYTFTDTATGCHSSDTTSLKVDACTGLTQSSKDRSILVFPNPTKNKVTLVLGENSVQGITVTDLLGRVLFSESINASQNELTVDLTNYNNGVYFVSLKMDHDVKIVKVIKE